MKKFLLTAVLTAVMATFLPSASGAAEYNLYFGDLHSHTSFSDGAGIPDEAYDMARYEAGLDFWTVSDHVEQLGPIQNPPPGAKTTDEWEYTKMVAAEKTENGVFIALAGFEWAMDLRQGHINVINTDDFTTFADSYPLARFYRWLHAREGAMAGFNHPSSNDDVLLVFDGMKLVPQVLRQMIFVATNRPRDFKYLYMALDNGWWVAPSAHQDNHSANWGLHPNGCLTAVYAESLTYDSLMEALAARRFYATTERALRLNFGVNGMPMGSRVTTDQAVLSIHVAHDGNNAIDSVELITNGGRTIQTWNPGGPLLETEVEAELDTEAVRWYLILARSGDKFAISAPVLLKK